MSSIDPSIIHFSSFNGEACVPFETKKDEAADSKQPGIPV